MRRISVDVAMAPQDYDPSWDERVCIAVDVLRSSSTIVTLLEEGCTEVYPMAGEEESRQLSKEKGMLLSGEHHGVQIKGFDMGNSPVEVYSLNIKGKRVILTTTNGTRLIAKARRCRSLMIGCFLNARACCHRALELARKHNCDISLLCAGEGNRFVLDDAYCVGYMVEEIYSQALIHGDKIELQDTARAALKIYNRYANVHDAFRDSRSGKRLLELGREDDLNFCSRMNVFDHVPVLKKGDQDYFTI